MSDEPAPETEQNVAELFEQMKAERDALLARETQLKEQLKGIVTKAPEIRAHEETVITGDINFDVMNIIKSIYGGE